MRKGDKLTNQIRKKPEGILICNCGEIKKDCKCHPATADYHYSHLKLITLEPSDYSHTVYYCPNCEHTLHGKVKKCPYCKKSVIKQDVYELNRKVVIPDLTFQEKCKT